MPPVNYGCRCTSAVNPDIVVFSVPIYAVGAWRYMNTQLYSV